MSQKRDNLLKAITEYLKSSSANNATRFKLLNIKQILEIEKNNEANRKLQAQRI